MRILGLVLVFVLVSGCDTVTEFMAAEDNAVPPSPLPEISQTLTVKQVWRANVGASTSERYIKLIPAIGLDGVFAADPEGRVTAYAGASGDRLWTTDADFEITGGPGAGEGLVLVGGSDGQILALADTDGALRWRARVSSEVLAAPKISQGIVVVRSVDGKLHGLNAENGKRLWIYDRSVPTLTLRGTSAPIISNDYVISGFDSGRLVAVALRTGRTEWETRLTVPRGRSELERLVDIDAEPMIWGDEVYAVTYQGRVAALDIYSGDVLWRRDMSSHAGMGVDEENLYVTDDKGHVWALDRGSSASVWKQSKLARRGVTAPVSIGEYVVVGDLEGYVHWLRQEDGQFVARVQADANAIIAPPVVVDDFVYVYSTGGELTALTVPVE